MIWKPTALAAVAVVIVGVAAGALIGGRTTVRTVEVGKLPDSAVPSASSTAAPSETPDATPAPSIGPVEDPIALSDDYVTINDETRNSEADEPVAIEELEYDVPVQLQTVREEFGSMKFTFGTACCGEGLAADYYELQLSVPYSTTHFRTTMGFIKGNAPGNLVRVNLYKNEYAEGEDVKQFTLNSAADYENVDLPVKGWATIIVRFSCENKGRVWHTAHTGR